MAMKIGGQAFGSRFFSPSRRKKARTEGLTPEYSLLDNCN